MFTDISDCKTALTARQAAKLVFNILHREKDITLDQFHALALFLGGMLTNNKLSRGDLINLLMTETLFSQVDLSIGGKTFTLYLEISDDCIAIMLEDKKSGIYKAAASFEGNFVSQNRDDFLLDKSNIAPRNAKSIQSFKRKFTSLMALHGGIKMYMPEDDANELAPRAQSASQTPPSHVIAIATKKVPSPDW